MIERAAPADAPSLHQIARRTFVHATPPDADPESIDEFVATALSEAAFRGHIDDAGSRVLIARTATAAEADDEAASDPGPTGGALGYALLLLERALPTEGAQIDRAQPVLQGRGLFLSKFYLLPEARGTGASDALMSACFDIARDLGVDFLWLTVNDQNARANAFYERRGLRIAGAASFQLGAQVHSDHLRAARL